MEYKTFFFFCIGSQVAESCRGVGKGHFEGTWVHVIIEENFSHVLRAADVIQRLVLL